MAAGREHGPRRDLSARKDYSRDECSRVHAFTHRLTTVVDFAVEWCGVSEFLTLSEVCHGPGPRKGYTVARRLNCAVSGEEPGPFGFERASA